MKFGELNYHDLVKYTGLSIYVIQSDNDTTGLLDSEGSPNEVLRRATRMYLSYDVVSENDYFDVHVIRIKKEN